MFLYQITEESNKKFGDITSEEKKYTREDAKERYLSYIFLRQSGNQHNKLKNDLQNNFTTGDDRYPKTRQATLNFLDKHSKSEIVIQSTSEVADFFQKGSNRY